MSIYYYKAVLFYKIYIFLIIPGLFYNCLYKNPCNGRGGSEVAGIFLTENLSHLERGWIIHQQ